MFSLLLSALLAQNRRHTHPLLPNGRPIRMQSHLNRIHPSFPAIPLFMFRILRMQALNCNVLNLVMSYESRMRHYLLMDLHETESKQVLSQHLSRLLGSDEGVNDVLEHLLTIESKEASAIMKLK
jgi:hypothetical protein